MPYNTGEIRALIAPLFDQPAENIRHFTITAQLHDTEQVVYLDSTVRPSPGEDPSASPDHNRRMAAHVALNLAGVIQDILVPLAREDEPQ